MDDWSNGFPSIFFTIIVFGILESPGWLLSKSRIEDAKIFLEKINPRTKMEDLMQEMQIVENVEQKGKTIFLKKYRFPLMLAFFIAVFNQFSGINAFLYYAPRIFVEAELEKSTALMNSVGIGITNLVSTLLGVLLIDIVGRKILVYVGSIGYIIFLGLVSIAFFLKWEGMAIPIFLCMFIASHAIGQGAVIWVFISEIFPNHLRNSGQAFGSSTHWFSSYYTINDTFFILHNWCRNCFSNFCRDIVFQLLFVIFMMPKLKENRYKSIRERSVK